MLRERVVPSENNVTWSNVHFLKVEVQLVGTSRECRTRGFQVT